MLIERDRKRPMRLIVTTVIFLVVAAMIYKNSMLITTVDTVCQALFTSSKTTGFVHTLMVLTAFLASPKMGSPLCPVARRIRWCVTLFWAITGCPYPTFIRWS